jgi:hypothetical protein
MPPETSRGLPQLIASLFRKPLPMHHREPVMPGSRLATGLSGPSTFPRRLRVAGLQPSVSRRALALVEAC